MQSQDSLKISSFVFVKKHLAIISQFIIFLTIYILWRWSSFIVWDDTSSASFNKYVNTAHFSFDKASRIVYEAFAYIQGDGYRPISAIIRGFGNAYFLSDIAAPYSLIVLNGFLFSISVILFLKLSESFLNTYKGQAAAAFLFFSSTPVLTGGLILFSGLQFLVYIFICLTLVLYFRYEKHQS